MTNNEISEKQKKYLFPCVINYYAEPISMESGSGVRLTDVEGTEYLDFFGGILTVSLGHCHPEVNRRTMEQMQKLQHVSTLYPTAVMTELAEKMAEIAPGNLCKSFFTSSGTEADETALMAAWLNKGHGDVIALRHCYSGRSLVAVNLCGHSNWRLIPSKIPGLKHAHAPYCYRCAMGLKYPECGLQCAVDLEELILTETCGKVAAFIAEPILGVGGFIVPPKEYFKIAVDIVRKHGGLFISDEVQSGFGRTGGKMNGIEHFDVEPDICTYAKGMANGAPVGATVTTPEVAASFTGLSISTFGGNPVSAAASLATIEIIQKENLVARCEVLGARLRNALESFADRFDYVGEVRGMGLMQAMELVEDRKTKEPAPAKAALLMEKARIEGLLIGKGGLYGNTLRISPPMLISESDLEEGIEKLGKAMESV